jgi:hypothetical protein
MWSATRPWASRWTSALSFLGSAFFLGRVHVTEPRPEAPGPGAITAGARFIKGSPVVRWSLLSVSLINFFNFVFFALFVLYATRSLHVRPGLLGLVLGAGGGLDPEHDLVLVRDVLQVDQAVSMAPLVCHRGLQFDQGPQGPRWRRACRVRRRGVGGRV